MNATDFGRLVKEARERVGMSQARLAELVGRSAGTVRAWERGSSLPTDPGVVTALAAALDLDEANLYRASGLEPPADAPTPTIEQVLQTIAPSEENEPQPGEDVESTPEEEPAPEPALVGEPRVRGRRVRERRPAVPTPPVVTASKAGWTAAEASYVEDPGERLVYRLRWLYTLVGLLFLMIVLVWASGRMLEAVGDVLDGLKASIGG